MSRAAGIVAACAVLAAGAGGFGFARGKRSIPLTKGTGYCVSVSDDGSFRGKVLVPFYKPSLKRLEALRKSVGDAVHLIGSEETDRRHQGNILAAAAHVVFEGETTPRAEFCITRCACSSKLTEESHETGAPVCGGPCQDCWDCRIDCSGVPGREKPGATPPPGGGKVLEGGPVENGNQARNDGAPPGGD